MTAPLPIGIEIPRSALCPSPRAHLRGQGGHDRLPVKRRKGDTQPRWKCSHCREEIRWDPDYYCYVTIYLIEEEPW